MFNNLPLIMHVRCASHISSPAVPPPRRRLTSDPVLIQRLRGESSLQFEADVLAPDTLYIQQIRDTVSFTELSDNNAASEETSPQIGSQDVLRESVEPRGPFAKIAQWAAARKAIQMMRIPAVWESHHVLSAIDRQDVETLMHIRDNAFELLLHDTGLHETPLKYAMRVQPDMAIILLGAFSRYINNLQDEDLGKDSVRTTLIALRADLHSAIRHGLANSQKDLIASFLQTLVMSEGDKWITDNISVVQQALDAGASGQPVHMARKVIRKFTTSALKTADTIAAVEDYMANAASDLLLMAAWASASKHMKTRPLPISFFARDDRVYRAFVEQLNSHMGMVEQTVPSKVRRHLELLREGMQGRRLSYKQKLEILSKQMDEPPGGAPQTAL